MQTPRFKHVSKNSVWSHNTTTGSTYVFGKNGTNQLYVPQKKFAHEKKNIMVTQ